MDLEIMTFITMDGMFVQISLTDNALYIKMKLFNPFFDDMDRPKNYISLN